MPSVEHAMKITVVGAGPLGRGADKLIEKAAMAALGAKAKASGELCVVFASDAQVHALNKRFLSHDRQTDVISFNYPRIRIPGGAKKIKSPAGQAARTGRPALRGLGGGGQKADDSFPFGDVYISLGVAKRQAKAMKHPLLREAVTLAVHGSLHLVGYDDGKPADKVRMFKRQDALVAKLLGKEEKTRR